MKFNVKKVDSGHYFNVSGLTPPTPPYTLYIGPILGQLNAGDETYLNSRTSSYTARRAFQIHSVVSSVTGEKIEATIVLSENYGASNNSCRIWNNSSERLTDFRVEYEVYDEVCFVRSSQTFWAHLEKSIVPGDSDYLYPFTTNIGNYGFGTEMYNPDEYKSFEIYKVVRIDSTGEHSIDFKGKLQLNMKNRFSTVTNISSEPFTYNYMLIKLIK